jgi:tRNA threonylcarbamoyl adenosine modification protein (Sua5/YciO/YrdC/YwlC family)
LVLFDNFRSAFALSGPTAGKITGKPPTFDEMAQFFSINTTHPQGRLIKKAAQIVRDGGVIGYPTDSCYALGCHLGDKAASDRLRRMRGIDDKHNLTIVCADLAQVAMFARVDNARFRFLKTLAPGAFTFILEATKELPRRALHARRKTIGVRIPDHAVVRALLGELQGPLLSATAILPGDRDAVSDAGRLRARLEHELALVLDAGRCGTEPTTVVDLTGPQAIVVRLGAGRLPGDLLPSWEMRA